MITPPFLELAEAPSWRRALEILDEAGWSPIAIGEWSWVHGSPGGEYAVRTTPFDPGFREFLTICRALPTNRHLPTIHGVFTYPDRSYSTVMERLEPADTRMAATFLEQWATNPPASDSRILYDRLTGHEPQVPFFAGPDTSPSNLMVRWEGTIVLTDGLRISGSELFETIMDDPSAAFALYPPEALQRFAHVPSLGAQASKAILSALADVEKEHPTSAA